MIVVSVPRSGGTKFCLDLSEKTNLPFFGELIIEHVDSYPAKLLDIGKIKRQRHEAGVNSQKEYTAEQFMTCLNKHKDHIILANTEALGLYPFADYFLLRRNPINHFKSWYCWTLKDVPEQALPIIVPNYIKFLYKNIASILDYCYYNGIEITWYEDLYDRETGYSGYDSRPDYIDPQLEETLSDYDIHAKYARVIQEYP